MEKEWKPICGRSKKKRERERLMTRENIDRRSRRWQQGREGEGAEEEEGEEGSYLLLMTVRVSEGWRAIQL